MNDEPPPRKKSRFFSSQQSAAASPRPILAAALAAHADQHRAPGPLDITSQQSIPATKISDTSPQHLYSSLPVQLRSSQRPENSPWHQNPAGQGSLHVPPHPKSSLMSPTADAFKDLTVSASKDRRKGVYGAQDLLSQHGRVAEQSQGEAQAAKMRLPTDGAQHGFGYDQKAHKVQLAQFVFSSSHNNSFPCTGGNGNPLTDVDCLFRNPDGSIDYTKAQELRQIDPSRQINCYGSTATRTQAVPPQFIQPSSVHQDTGPLGFPQLRSTTPPQGNFIQSFRQQPHPARRDYTTDRDPTGWRLPNPCQPPIASFPHSGISNLPFHATLTPRKNISERESAPPTYFTSPNRIDRAFSSAHHTTSKRKRPGFELPPPAYIYTRTNSALFNVFHGILLYPELCFHLASHLPLNDLISLYAISRDYHTILNTRLTTVILSHSLRRAPESSRVFAFRCYSHLCVPDPAKRIPHPDPKLAARNIVRKVPSFRWLKMVLYREQVVHEIMTIMAEDGVPMPRRCGLALKKMWFTLDIPDNARRIGYSHNRALVSDLDLYFIVCVIVKMDMRFNDPIAPEKRDGVRRLLLAQRSLSVWLRVLKRECWTTELDVMREWMRWKYDPLPHEVRRAEPIFGVPVTELGRLKHEYWGDRRMEAYAKTDSSGNRILLLRPDQLVVREVVRRGLTCTRHYLRCLLYGYVDPRTLEDFEPRRMGRRINEWRGEEYEIDGDVGGVWRKEDVMDESGEDPLLDLGPGKSVSLYCIKREGVNVEEAKRRAEVDELVERMFCMWEGRQDG